MFACLRHRAVSSVHNQDRAVHLRCARDHVLHVVGVAWAVNVRVVALVALILNVRCRNRNTARLFFRRLVNLVIRHEVLRKHLRHRRRQRRLSMVHVTNRSNVTVRLVALEFFLRHVLVPLVLYVFAPRGHMPLQKRLKSLNELENPPTKVNGFF